MYWKGCLSGSELNFGVEALTLLRWHQQLLKNSHSMIFIYIYIYIYFFTETGQHKLPLVLLFPVNIEIFFKGFQGLTNSRSTSRSFQRYCIRYPINKQIESTYSAGRILMPYQSAWNNFFHLTFTNFWRSTLRIAWRSRDLIVSDLLTLHSQRLWTAWCLKKKKKENL